MFSSFLQLCIYSFVFIFCVFFFLSFFFVSFPFHCFSFVFVCIKPREKTLLEKWPIGLNYMKKTFVSNSGWICNHWWNVCQLSALLSSLQSGSLQKFHRNQIHWQLVEFHETVSKQYEKYQQQKTFLYDPVL